MKFLTIYLLISTISFEVLHAQNAVQMQQTLEDLGTSSQSYFKGVDNRHEGVKGSAYLHDEWREGTVETSSGLVFNNEQLRYDTYLQALQVKNKRNGGITVLNTSDVKWFSLSHQEENNKFIRFTEQQDDPKIFDNFFQVLTEGPVSLLALHQAVFQKANYQGAYSANKTYDEFIPGKTFYYLDSSGTPTKLKTNRKTVEEIFSTRGKEVSNYIKTESIDLKSESDLIKLFEHFNH